MEGLQIYPITKLCYKRQDHVLGIEIGREDVGVKFVFYDFKQGVHFSLFKKCMNTMCEYIYLLVYI